VRLEPLVAPPYEPEIIAVVWLRTALVVTLKFMLAKPAGTVALGGTLATDGLSLARETVTPPVGAAPVRFTVPRAMLPPTTVVGLTVTDDNPAATGTTVIEVLAVPL